MTHPRFPLLELAYDDTHRAHMIADQNMVLPYLRARVHAPLHWDSRYAPYVLRTGFLPIARTVCMGLPPMDGALLTALVDRWRSETHTFHMPCGEMTVTLEDMAMITALSLEGAPNDWRVTHQDYLHMWDQRQRHKIAEGEDWFAGENQLYLRWFYTDDYDVDTRWGNQPERAPLHDHMLNCVTADHVDPVRGPGGSSDSQPTPGWEGTCIVTQGESSQMNMTQTQEESSQPRWRRRRDRSDVPSSATCLQTGFGSAVPPLLARPESDAAPVVLAHAASMAALPRHMHWRGRAILPRQMWPLRTILLPSHCCRWGSRLEGPLVCGWEVGTYVDEPRQRPVTTTPSLEPIPLEVDDHPRAGMSVTIEPNRARGLQLPSSGDLHLHAVHARARHAGNDALALRSITSRHDVRGNRCVMSPPMPRRRHRSNPMAQWTSERHAARQT
nr:unnamed protein product [Digitaria exilis]